MLEKSQCHTDDRNNYLAQRDCNIEQRWLGDATESNFNMNYWPYIHNEDVKECLKSISLDGWDVISEMGGRSLAASAAVALAAWAMYM
mmetsp:Transcript_4493/g.6744  ORF Transcript_4493/g.6744 Transcript_4493/m.6744 type:complete len:88 (+) Transcript_4493:1071-1334(+)